LTCRRRPVAGSDAKPNEVGTVDSQERQKCRQRIAPNHSAEARSTSTSAREAKRELASAKSESKIEDGIHALDSVSIVAKTIVHDAILIGAALRARHAVAAGLLYQDASSEASAPEQGSNLADGYGTQRSELRELRDTYTFGKSTRQRQR